MQHLNHLKEPIPERVLDRVTPPARIVLGLALVLDTGLVVARTAGTSIPPLLAGLAAALTIATLPSVLSRFLGDFAGWVYLFAVLAGLILGAALYLFIDDGPNEILTGSLGSDRNAVHHALSREPGDRIVATLTTTGELTADMTLIGARDAPVQSQALDTGERRIDLTVPSGDFTIAVRRLSGAGDYEVSVSVDKGRQLHSDEVAGQVIEHDMSDAADSDGYVFDLSADQTLALALGAVDGGGFRLQVANTEGFIKGSLSQADGGQPVNGEIKLRPGRYVLIVRLTSDGSAGTYRLALGSAELALEQPITPTPVSTPPGNATPPTPASSTTTAAPGSTPAPALAPAPTPGVSVVPDVFGLSVDEGIAILRNAGFEVQVIPVCSNSVSPGLVRQVFTYDAGGTTEVPVVDKPGLIDDDERVRQDGAQLFIKEAVGPC